jgi:precorrin-2 dehydrogenase/sirohydrochlorin ferrochelatase
LFIDLKLAGKNVIVVGGGAEAYRKTQSFLDSGATIWVISRKFSNAIVRLGENKKVALLKTDIKDAKSFVESLNPQPDVFLAVTDNSKLNLELVETAKTYKIMVYAVDNPAVSDFMLPAIGKIGDVKVAISTSGRSPAMAHILRKRIEKLVTPQDLLWIELLAKMREVLKERISDAKKRSIMLYEILNNNDVKQALCKNNIQGAQKLAMKLLESRERQL